jgi:hypothetical protein
MGVTRFAQPGRTSKATTNTYGTDLGAASAANLANTVYVEGAGAKNAYTGTTTSPMGSLTKGTFLVFKSGATTNDAASTLDINGIGAKAIVTNANAALAGGEFVNGTVYVLVYDGTSFRIL